MTFHIREILLAVVKLLTPGWCLITSIILIIHIHTENLRYKNKIQ